MGNNSDEVLLNPVGDFAVGFVGNLKKSVGSANFSESARDSLVCAHAVDGTTSYLPYLSRLGR